jgi:Outer membrane protein Omp28/Secretion system C-terminal sorting domain
MKKTLLTSFLLIIGFVNAQTFVPTTAQNKKVILEEFTGVNCVFCPQGHTIANNIKNADPNNVFLINIHVGGFATPGAGQPDFRTSFGTAIAGQSGLTGYPAGTVNRSVFAGLQQGAAGTTAMSRNNWSSASNTTKAQSSYVNVALQASINVQTNVLTVTVESYYTGTSPVATNKLNVALLQNNTLGPQTGGNMGNNYNHQHRLVHMLTGQWGTTISSTTTGSFNTQTFTYTIPAAYNGVPTELADMELVAFVSETEQKIISGNGAKPTFTGLLANDIEVKSILPIADQCSSAFAPKIKIQNKSQNNLTNLTINYSYNGGTNQVYNWTGNLTPMGISEVQLPISSFSLLPTNTLSVSVPNDDNNSNNVVSSNFNKAAEAVNTNITIKISTDQYGSETTWNLKNGAGTIVAQGGPYSDAGAGVYPQPDVNVTLPFDCYTFTIADSYGDGMCCAYGNGGYQILANNVLIAGMSGGAFGTGETKKFAVVNPLSVSDFELNSIRFYPNPTTGIVTISLFEESTVSVIDLSGKQVMIKNLEMGEATLDMSSLTKGMYLIQVTGENYTKTEKIILN